MQWADALLYTLCAREHGVGLVAVRYTEQPVYDSELFYGPWTTGQAEKFAFVQPSPDADLRANGVIPSDAGEPSVYAGWASLNDHVTQAERDGVAQSCGGGGGEEAADSEWTFNYDTPWQAKMAALGQEVVKDAAYGELLEELYLCFDRSGMEAHADEPGVPEGAKFRVIDKEQIALAVKTVQCKDETGFTRKMADLWASYQVPVLVEYQREIVAQGEALRTKLDEADVLMSDHPEAYEMP